MKNVNPEDRPISATIGLDYRNNVIAKVSRNLFYEVNRKIPVLFFYYMENVQNAIDYRKKKS